LPQQLARRNNGGPKRFAGKDSRRDVTGISRLHLIMIRAMLAREAFAREHLAELKSDIRDRAKDMLVEWKQAFRREFQHTAEKIAFNDGKPDRSSESGLVPLHGTVFEREFVGKVAFEKFGCLAENLKRFVSLKCHTGLGRKCDPQASSDKKKCPTGHPICAQISSTQNCAACSKAGISFR
jgi:hypothetical protein